MLFAPAIFAQIEKITTANQHELNAKNVLFNAVDWTPLMLAARDGNLEKAKLLIDEGADVNVANKNGLTALWLASAKGNLEIIKLLVEKGVDVNAIGKYNSTAIRAAKSSNHWEIANYLRAHGAKD